MKFIKIEYTEGKYEFEETTEMIINTNEITKIEKDDYYDIDPDEKVSYDDIYDENEKRYQPCIRYTISKKKKYVEVFYNDIDGRDKKFEQIEEILGSDLIK